MISAWVALEEEMICSNSSGSIVADMKDFINILHFIFLLQLRTYGGPER